MSIKVFQTNKAGKIEFTRCELEKLLNETYKEGYKDGEERTKNDYWTWTSPYISPTINSPTITYRNSTDPIDNLMADKTLCTNEATISTTNCSINTDELKKLSGQSPSNDKTFKVDITTSIDSPNIKRAERACQIEDLNLNLSDLAKTVDAMLNGKIDLFNPANVKSGKIAMDNPFNNLEKELRGL